MNWKLICSLSLFGLFMAFATVYFIPSNVELFCWIVIFIICAVIIGKNAPGKYFAHGFMVSIVNCIWITSAHVLLYDKYIIKHQDELQQMAPMVEKMHISNQVVMMIMGPVIGILCGLVLGLLSMIAGKALGKKKPMYTT